jgi:CheY-like chemotaxis protein
VISVADTGHGMDTETQSRIFEPFFTTKDKDKGTGLGLAIVFSIVKQHRGWIVCDSKQAGGTTFDIFLPRCEVSDAVRPVATARPEADTKRETILLVDDESMIRQLASTILSKAGYEVLHAENGEKAVEVFRAHQDRIALVILDAVMPRLSGRETLRELVKIAPNVSVLFSSGFSTEQLALNEFPQVRGFLSKPYRAEQLIQKVEELLGQSHRASTD